MRKESSQTRRVRVERGIYRRRTAAGAASYEITYTDSTGRQRWQRVPGGLREARAARAAVVAKLARGERVVKSDETFEQASRTHLATADLRERTRETYLGSLERHVFPIMGNRKLTSINEDDLLAVIAEMREKGRAPWTIKGALVPTGRVLNLAVRRGIIPSSPLARLDRSERPHIKATPIRVLERDEIAAVLDATIPSYRVAVSTAIFTGLRQSEQLGLQWADIDFTEGVLHVRRTFGREGKIGPPKTDASYRSVVLMPSLARVLREHKLRSSYSQPEDFVFSTTTGRPAHWRNVSRRGLGAAVKKSGVPHVAWHELRHTFASLLIAEGLNVVYVSRQLGHSSPAITLALYAHLFDRYEHAQRARTALEAGFGSVLGGVGHVAH